MTEKKICQMSEESSDIEPVADELQDSPAEEQTTEDAPHVKVAVEEQVLVTDADTKKPSLNRTLSYL